MKKLIIPAIAIALLATGCQSSSFKKRVTRPDATVEEVDVSIWSHMFKRDVDSFTLKRTGEGEFDLALNGYKSDTSEQLPATISQAFAGLALIGRIAGAAVNPAVASVPLTSDPADANAIAQIQQSLATSKAAEAAAKAELTKAKAEAAKAKAEAAAANKASDCPNGECEL